MPYFQHLCGGLEVKSMKRLMLILAAVTLLAGCHTGRERNGMGGTGSESPYDTGTSSDIQTNSNFPGGDVRPNHDGDSGYGITP